MIVSRRSLILTSASLRLARAQSPAVVILGGVIVGLFREIVKVALDELITSAAKHIWSNYIDPRRSTTAAASYYIENGHAADNFCAYCTVEFAQRSKTYWNGSLFQPNEENQFYRSRQKPTDLVLAGILSDNDSLWHLDSSRNRNAHIPPGVLANIRGSVERLQQNKNRLYNDIVHATLRPAALKEYMIDRLTLDEIDKQYIHVTSTSPDSYHINPKYVDSLILLQKYVTWFNTKLGAIDTANARRDIFASTVRARPDRMGREYI